jgi:GH25 family lysozyme M1 (1,4-beta-N-acetylmuramidase)
VYKNPAPGVAGNLTTHGTGPSNWLAGIDVDSFEGSTVGERVARAAASIGADYLSPVVVAVRCRSRPKQGFAADL